MKTHPILLVLVFGLLIVSACEDSGEIHSTTDGDLDAAQSRCQRDWDPTPLNCELKTYRDSCMTPRTWNTKYDYTERTADGKML